MLLVVASQEYLYQTIVQFDKSNPENVQFVIYGYKYNSHIYGYTHDGHIYCYTCDENNNVNAEKLFC